MLSRALCLCFMSFTVVAQACVPKEQTRASLLALKSGGFVLTADQERNALALALIDCLGDADPELRDDIAYSALAKWLRADQIDEKTRQSLFDRLLPLLKSRQASGFEAPFAALVLSEVARTDRIKSWLTAEQRTFLIVAAAEFLAGVSDYRGFSDGEGWRHGVAHGADLVLQLGLNAKVQRPELDRLIDALLSQVAPAGTHFYRFGEPERLARPLLHIASRKLHSPEEMQAWMQRLTDPLPLSSWETAFASEQGLAKRHNTMAFLLIAYANASLTEDGGMRAMQTMLADALKKLP